MSPALELTDATFGALTVLERADKDPHGAWRWYCRCDCGRTVVVRAATLKAGRTSSCSSCASSAKNITHGMSGTPMYWRWRGMLARVDDPQHRHFANYGGRGITVCDRWRDFARFVDDMGSPVEPQMQLDRIDNDGPYSPNNCRWASFQEQQRNKRTNHTVEFRGCTQTIQEWSEALGIKANTIVHRLRRGWSTRRALTKGADHAALLRLANGDPS